MLDAWIPTDFFATPKSAVLAIVAGGSAEPCCPTSNDGSCTEVTAPEWLEIFDIFAASLSSPASSVLRFAARFVFAVYVPSRFAMRSLTSLA